MSYSYALGRPRKKRFSRSAVKPISVIGALFFMLLIIGMTITVARAAVFDSTADPNVLPMLDGFKTLPQSALDENDQKAIAINNGATSAERTAAEGFYQYPFSQFSLATLTYAGGLDSAYAAANSAGEVSLVNTLLAQANYNNADSAFLESQSGTTEWVSSDNAKNVYQYPRPYCRLPQINPMDGSGCPTTYGYPSGHTKIAWTEGVGLAIMLPEVAPQILARTAEISNGRIVVGAHYPLDVMAGRAIATRMIAYRMHDDTWKAKFDAARTQLRNALESHCGMTIAACLVKNPPSKSYADSRAYSRDKLTYGFSRVGTAGQAFQAPDFSYELLDYAYPSMTQTEKEAILVNTAIDSGYPLDTTGSANTSATIGWTRLDLGAALNQPDTTKPTVTWRVPAADSTVSGTTTLGITATDNTAIQTAVFYGGSAADLTGAVSLGTGTYNSATDRYELSLDTTTLPNGDFYIVADAADIEWNVTRSSTYHFVVNNGGSSDTTKPTVSLAAPTNGATISGMTTLSANATDDSGTVSKVEFYQGTALLGSDMTAPYSYDWDTSNAVNGTYTLTAKAFDAANNSASSTAVTVTVNNTTTPPADTTAPTVSLTAPAAGTISGTVAITATATDNVKVTKVEFWANGVKLNEVTTSPYSFSWDTTALQNGDYALSAKAFDAANNSASSTAVTVTVNNTTTPPADTTAPTVSLTAPAAGTISGTVAITATATDNVKVTKVEFYQGTTLIASDTTAPFSADWDTTKVADGTYTLTAKAFDAANNSASSTAVSVAVGNMPPAQAVTTVDLSKTTSAEPAAISKAVMVVSNGSCADIANAKTVAASNISVAETGVALLGGFDFSLNCTASGGTASLEITLGQRYADTSKLRAYKSTGSSVSDVSSKVTFKNTATATVLSYTLTDGTEFDTDGIVNGKIDDPLYVGVLGESTTAPTNQEAAPAPSPKLVNTGIRLSFTTLGAVAAVVGALKIFTRTNNRYRLIKK